MRVRIPPPAFEALGDRIGCLTLDPGKCHVRCAVKGCVRKLLFNSNQPTRKSRWSAFHPRSDRRVICQLSFCFARPIA